MNQIHVNFTSQLAKVDSLLNSTLNTKYTELKEFVDSEIERVARVVDQLDEEIGVESEKDSP